MKVQVVDEQRFWVYHDTMPNILARRGYGLKQ